MKALERAVCDTEAVWRARSTVMRAAVDHSALHAVVGAAWSDTVARFARTMAQVLRNTGMADDDGPNGASALADALCWMTERTFYRAARLADEDLSRVGTTISEIWRKVMTNEPLRVDRPSGSRPRAEAWIVSTPQPKPRLRRRPCPARR
ncbi:hypothetical protein [Streptomyces tendae]|uniref:hypothetical protein n=1 Tax=Streptomyces tendae TaxID=1932 RepID=UPI0036CBEE9E